MTRTVAIAGAVVLLGLVACSSNTETHGQKTSCGSGGVTVTSKNQTTGLLSCAGTAGIADTYTLRLAAGDSAKIRSGGVDLHLGTTTLSHPIVSFTGQTISAVGKGTATITEVGWPCANLAARCTLLNVVVGH